MTWVAWRRFRARPRHRSRSARSAPLARSAGAPLPAGAGGCWRAALRPRRPPAECMQAQSDLGDDGHSCCVLLGLRLYRKFRRGTLSHDQSSDICSHPIRPQTDAAIQNQHVECKLMR